MKSFIQTGRLAVGVLVSLGALGLAFGAGALLKMDVRVQAESRRASAASDSPKGSPGASPDLQAVTAGRTLFLKNCAHCHGDDARGDEGPDLHGLTRSDEWIARRIRNGVKGEMTAFGGKFSQSDIDAIVAYLRTLR